ncbi:uncharacterized protein LOC132272686 [Cornus florida]|uniref:uncharacterized protein LOC132272686 n=1 Tax=Cornus florida TaxID=4283 RepID=UPI00289F1258|nr:uncharacterized protein LOC132272686 [Cornus florida]
MNPVDEEKTSFITEKGTYCYKVMLFGLKNVRVTYQRLVNKIFNEMLGKTVETYIDDMVVESVKKEDHPKHIQEVFDTLRKEVQVLTGRIAALSCFISRLSDKCKPFFDAIRSKNKDIWGLQQQVTLNQLKCYMAKPPILSTPKLGETLIIYLAISDIATSAVLIREEGKNQYPVFCTSKTMTDAETRITKWAIELSSFDISYEPKVSHKGQALADFLLEYEDKSEEPNLSEPQWELRVDGFSNLTSAGARIVITTPEGTELQQSIRLTFYTTNNEVEYGALLTGLRLVIDKYQPKEERMKVYKEAIESATYGFDQIEFRQVPREENSKADQLAKATSSSDEDLVRIVPIDILYELSISHWQDIIVIPDIPREPCWIDPLEAYLKHGTLSNQKAEAKKLRFTAAKYSIINNQLYQKSFLGPYLKCLSPTKALVILKQIHDEDCGNHSGGRSLAYKVLTQGYLWPYLARNAEKYAKRCDKC